LSKRCGELFALCNEVLLYDVTSTYFEGLAAANPHTYPKGIKVSEEQMAALNLKGDEFHPDWSYSISPRGQIVEP
jgi:hypothetical protein